MSIIALTPTLVISPKLQHNRLELSFQVGASLCRWRLEGQPFHWAKCQELRLCLIRLQCAREGFFFLWRCRLQFKRLHGLGLHKIHTTFRCQPPSELQYHPRLLHWHMPTAYHWGIPKQDDHHRWLFPFRDRESLQRPEIPSLGDSEIYFP